MPFSDGKTSIKAQAYTSIFIETNGRALIENLMSQTVLHFIDLHWKNHLRAMDDLKQAVQNAVYERQDPIITFKFEAYHLFKKFIATINQEIVSFLFHAMAYMQTEPIKS